MSPKLKLFSGVGLLILGVLGLILPIMPGIPFLIAGAAILGTEHPLIRPFKKFIDKWRREQKDDAPAADKTASTCQPITDSKQEVESKL